jgi:hypothetical protein
MDLDSKLAAKSNAITIKCLPASLQADKNDQGKVKAISYSFYQHLLLKKNWPLFAYSSYKSSLFCVHFELSTHLLV